MARLEPLVNDEIYHVFTRGVDKRDIFNRDIDYLRFLLIMYLVNDVPLGQLHLGRLFENNSGQSPALSSFSKEGDDREKLVEIMAWALMSNHPHLLLKQLKENGISIFMHRLLTSHAKYYNKVYDRVGSLFGGRFKAVHINKDEQFTHVSRYIHLNPLEFFDPTWKERGYVEDKVGAEKFLKEYRWSSLPDYLGYETDFAPIVDKGPIMDHFDNNSEDYWKFIMDWTKPGFVHQGMYDK